MNCPACRATIADSAPSCELCTASITRDAAGEARVAFPEIRPGNGIFALDFRRVPLPGEAARDRKYDDGDSYRGIDRGIIVDAVNDIIWRFRQPYLRLRDACVAVSCVTYAPRLYPRVFLRSTEIESSRVRYDLVVSPEDRSFRVIRYCGAKHGSDAVNLAGWSQHDAVAPTGSRNVLELRALGATLQAWINGTHVASVHDPVLGIGAVGLANERCLEGSTEPKMTLWEWLEARTVSP